MNRFGVFNPDMLLTARNYNGFSQTEVAKRCGISQSRYSKIEGAAIAIDPNDQVIDKFSETLGFPPAFFFKNAKALGVPASFHEMYRKPKSVGGKKTLGQVTADLTIKMMSVSKLLDSVDIEPKITLPQYEVEEYDNDASEIARMVRRTWMLPAGPVRNLTKLVEEAGVIIYPMDFIAQKVDGVTIKAPGMPPLIFLNANTPADRLRFSLAHELGHVIMHRQMTATMEDEANEFAAELLMPEHEMRTEFSNHITLDELARLKRIRKVSMAALLYRAQSIGKVTKNQAAYLWRQMAQYRKHEPLETSFEKEVPTSLKDIVDIFRSNLDYKIPDFSNSFALYDDKTLRVLSHAMPQERKLRLVV